jgi:CHASE3 domain sensor protein
MVQDGSQAESKRVYLRELGLPTIFGAVVLFASATLLLAVNISALRDNLKWMEHAQKVLMKIADVETGLLGDELTVRGYALTLDKRFLGFQEIERTKSIKAARELVALTAVEPEHAASFLAVLADFQRHVQIFGDLHGKGPEVVSKAIIDPAIRANMKRCRNGLAALRAAEVNDLGQHQREMTQQLTYAFLLAIGIIIASFLLGGFGLVASQIHLHLRR